MEQENRLKITVWLKPDVVQRMDGWLKVDNCKSRGEFTEKALRFYMGYLATEDTSVFLSRTLVDTLQGIVADSHNRLRSMIFKWCVELNMMGHTIAAHFRADPINRRELRAYAVDEVRRTNGQISFDRALDQQRRFPEDIFSPSKVSVISIFAISLTIPRSYFIVMPIPDMHSLGSAWIVRTE